MARSAEQDPIRWRLAVAVLLVQVAYWLLLSPVFQPTRRPLDRLPQTSFAVAEVPSPGWVDVSAATFREVSYPWEDCCEPGYRAVRIRFDLAAIPDDGLGEVPVIGADNYETRVNGTLVFGEGRMRLPDPSYQGRAYRGINRIPGSALRIGENEIIYTLVRGDGGSGFFAARPTLGSYPALVSHFGFTRFLLNDYLWLSIVIGYLTALLAGVAWLRGGRQQYLFWLALLAGAWATSLFQGQWIDPWLRGRALVLLGGALTLLLPVAWLNLVNVWGGRPWHWVMPLSALMWLGGFVVFASGLFDDWGSIDRIVFVFNGVAALLLLWLLLREFPRVGRERMWEYAIFLLCATILLRDAVGSVTRLPNWGIATDLVLPFLLVALMAAFVARNIRLFRSQRQLSDQLETQLRARTADLERAHAREREHVRAQALDEERQRIMRDMHDGLGSNLMSMLVAARRGIAEPQQVADGIQSAIDEMRLMIDSMDSVGESLQSALAVFRERTATRLQAAGVALEWQESLAAALPARGPREVLQVFRILQEAVTNALKHADAKRIAVTVHWAGGADDAVVIAVSDDGRGMDVAGQGRGRGLLNMRSRAQSIGGELHIDDAAPGTRVTLSLPPDGGVHHEPVMDSGTGAGR